MTTEDLAEQLTEERLRRIEAEEWAGHLARIVRDCRVAMLDTRSLLNRIWEYRQARGAKGVKDFWRVYDQNRIAADQTMGI